MLSDKGHSVFLGTVAATVQYKALGHQPISNPYNVNPLPQCIVDELLGIISDKGTECNDYK